MTDPYSVGTVSVSNGSTTVTGTGTLWLGKVRKNDMFFDPAQGLMARVTADPTVDDELSITAWAGASMSGDVYEIIPASDTTTSAARLRDLLSDLTVIEANGRGLFYRFSDTTTDADPGAGTLRLNNADASMATALYIDSLDANGATATGEIDAWDDSTSILKGRLWLRSIADPSSFRVYRVTGSVVDGTGYRKVALAHVGGSGSFIAGTEMMVFFVPNGDQGDSFVYDATADDLTGRAAYDDEAAGFVVLVLDNGASPSRSAFYTMGAGGSGDWSLTGYLTGPVGPAPNLSIGTVTTGAPGSAAAATIGGTSPNYTLDLEIPEGLRGVTWKPGGYDAGVTYAKNDATLYNGSAVISLQDGNLNHTPPTLPATANAWWEIIGQKGQDGSAIERIQIGGRLTLVSGDPLSEADTVGASTVYLTPALTNLTELYNGSGWTRYTFAELTLGLVASHLADNNYDVWEFDNGGSLQIGTGPSWADGAAAGSDYARGTGAGSTELEMIEGRIVNKVAMTVRNGATTYAVAARAARLRGTIRMTANGQTEDSKSKRFVSNLHNAEPRPMQRSDTTDSWAYSTATWRMANGSNLNRVQYVQCVAGRKTRASVLALVYNSTTTYQNAAVGIGINSATINHANITIGAVANNRFVPCSAHYQGFPGIGHRVLNWIEMGAGADTQTWVGDFGGMAYFQTGLEAETIL